MPATNPVVEVILIVPGLDRVAGDLGAAFAASDDASVDPIGVACGGAFERSVVASLPWESDLMNRLGFLTEASEPAGAYAPGTSAGDIPAARLFWELDGKGVPPPHLVIADPVSMTPGRDEATLIPPQSLALPADELAAFVAAANRLLAGDGISFELGGSGRWYLKGLDARALRTPPTHFVSGRDVGAWLPGTAEAAPWRRLMTELQMLWHADPLNEARTARDLPPLNGIWFWGGAELPGVPPVPPALTLVARDPLALALGRHAGVAVRGPEAFARGFDELLADTPPNTTLAIVDLAAQTAWLANDADALDEARARCTERWLAPAARAVVEDRARSLSLGGGDAHESRFVPPRRRSWFARVLGR